MIEIDKNVPLPQSTRRGSSRYPWALLEVGDSFLVVGVGAKSMPSQATIQGRLLGRKFSTSARNQNGGIRVWRIE